MLMDRKKIVFLTGTRADFSKLRSLIKITQESAVYEVHIFVTGMHMNPLYGMTVNEILKDSFINIYTFVNYDNTASMDKILANTIIGLTEYVSNLAPDLIVVHGDRVEALSGAIVGSLNNILVAHVEGGEISGTIDELIRHSVSKMAHIHMVTNAEARNRLIQLGEIKQSIFVIGSPDLDLMNPDNLPSIEHAKKYYNISFDKYAIAIFHPVTTEREQVKTQAKNFVDGIIESGLCFIVIYPNNDCGSKDILDEYERLYSISRFKIFPSLRFEYFLTLLNNSDFMIGNSSSGLREAPYYLVPTIDIGTRQNNRVKLRSVHHCGYKKSDILKEINEVVDGDADFSNEDVWFGDGDSDKRFKKILDNGEVWNIKHQKQFQEL
jgi:UDP-N-acetylglucosamine 2-epimerase (hydrolysing)